MQHDESLTSAIAIKI